MKFIASALIAAFTISALADSPNSPWNRPTHGYIVRINTPNPVATVPGRTTEFTGDVRFVDIDADERDGDEDSDTPIRTILTKENTVLKAYFPDELTEVTDQVTWTDTQSQVQFRFTTPTLQAGAMNRLTVRVVDRSKNWDKLLETKAKIEQRILDIDARIADLARQTGGKPKEIQNRQKKIADLTETRTQLVGVVASIQAKIQTKQSIIAEAKIPVQLGNLPAPEGYVMNMMGGYLFETKSQLGVVPQKQSTSIISKITRIKVFPKNDTKDWRVEYSWNGTEINEQVLDQIDEFQVIDYTYSAQNLLPSQLSLFKSQVSRIKNSKHSRLWGFTEFKIPVATDTIAPKWAVSSSFDTQARYAQSFDALSISVEDEIGTIDPDSFIATLNGNDIKSSLSTFYYNNSAGLSLSGDLNALAPNEGDYTVTLRISDTVGHRATPDPKSMSVTIDRTAPVLNLEPIASSNRNPIVPVVLTISDHSPTQTQITLNGETVYSDSDPTIIQSLTLTEGLNILEITSTDAAGNVTQIQRPDIFLDSTPPQIAITSPTGGTIYTSLSVPVSGTANEPLLYAKINNQPIPLDGSLTSFSGSFASPTSGIISLHFEFSDLAGNISTQDASIELVTSVLNENLLSVIPDPDGIHLLVRGAQNATRPNARVSASGGFFNSASGTADANGAFTLKLNLFTTAEVSAIDDNIGMTSTGHVHWGTGGGTLLSGVVKDVDEQPLANVRVSLSTGGTPIYTNADGIFTFSEPIIGDQTLVIDGSTAIQPPEPAPRRIFGRTSIAVTVGLSQSNVLSRPIYLVPTPNTLDVPTVDASSGATVTSSDAPGVTLDIPASTAQFPNGNTSAPVYIRTLPVQVSTVLPPDVAQPTKVIALEPSGTTFTEPVKLSLPNDSELPPNTEMAILSMNSATGQWEIGGAARVTSDGSRIETKDGMGIKHFSLVYASPLGPMVRPIGSQDRPGADTFNGALTTSIKLPTYKSLGKDVGASLIYRSNWAKPTVTVSNLLDTPMRQVDVQDDSEGTIFHLKYTATVRQCIPHPLGIQFPPT